MYIPTLIDPESDNLIDRHRKHLWGPKQHSKQTKPCAVEPPRHRAFFVLWRLAECPNSEPEAPGNPHKQRKKQRKQDSSRGARGWAGWMRVCAGMWGEWLLEGDLESLFWRCEDDQRFCHFWRFWGSTGVEVVKCSPESQCLCGSQALEDTIW